MTIKFYPEMEQGSDEWFAARCGLMTASEMKHVITPTMKLANNDKTRQHVWELLAQRITRYTEPSYIGDDMLRGWEDEIQARIEYSEAYAPVKECGFVTNDKWGFTLGYSPDGLVGEKGVIECKSRKQKYQVQTIVEHADGTVHIPQEFVLQVQTGLLITERDWCDFISYSAGLPMITIRVYADDEIQDKIIEAAAEFEAKIEEARQVWENDGIMKKLRLIPTERNQDEELVV